VLEPPPWLLSVQVRNQMAIIRSSEYAPARAAYDEKARRQQQVLELLSPKVCAPPFFLLGSLEAPSVPLHGQARPGLLRSLPLPGSLPCCWCQRAVIHALAPSPPGWLAG
jgi:hypothetical protein